MDFLESALRSALLKDGAHLLEDLLNDPLYKGREHAIASQNLEGHALGGSPSRSPLSGQRPESRMTLGNFGVVRPPSAAKPATQRTLNLLAAHGKPRKICPVIVAVEIFANSFEPVCLVGSHAEIEGLLKMPCNLNFQRSENSRKSFSTNQ